MKANFPKNLFYAVIPYNTGISFWLILLFLCVSYTLKAQILAEADCPDAYPICDASQSYYFEVNGPGAIDDAYGAMSLFCQANTSATTFEYSSAWFTFTPNYSGEFGFYILPEIEEDWEYLLFGNTPDCTDLHNTTYHIACSTESPGNSVNAYTGIGDHPIQGGGTIDGFLPYITVNAGEKYILFITTFVADGGFNHRATITFQGGLINTYGADAFEELEACTLGVEEFGGPIVQVFPNPARDVLHIESQNTIDTIAFYTLLGQRVLFTTATSLTETLDLSVFSSGLYLVRVTVGDRVETFRVVRE